MNIRCLPMGETALLVEVAEADASRANRAACVLASAINQSGEATALQGISSVTVRFDALHTQPTALAERIAQLAAGLRAEEAAPAHIVEIPVRYGGDAGLDLFETAGALGTTPQRIVELHTSQPWPVMLIGFAPGFPYIGPMPLELTLPRRATPRAAVKAGSVALAAGMSGIYPARLPGGWHIIGRTDVVLFDPARNPPTLLQAGYWVKFTVESCL